MPYSRALISLLVGDRGSDRSIRKSSLCPSGHVGWENGVFQSTASHRGKWGWRSAARPRSRGKQGHAVEAESFTVSISVGPAGACCDLSLGAVLWHVCLPSHLMLWGTERGKSEPGEMTGRLSLCGWVVACLVPGKFRLLKPGFPGGSVVENSPANAGDTGSSPGLGRSHMPRSS